MQTSSFSNRKFWLMCIAFCGAMLAAAGDARALSIGDSHDMGFVWPGTQQKNDNQSKMAYVNHLPGMGLGMIDIDHGEVYLRSNHGFKSLPAASQALNGGGRTIRLAAGGLYTYLFATYKGYGAQVWYVGNLNGIITIPLLAAGHALTGWTLFGPGSVGVPDGGLTVALLGVALAVIALTRRFLMR